MIKPPKLIHQKDVAREMQEHKWTMQEASGQTWL